MLNVDSRNKALNGKPLYDKVKAKKKKKRMGIRFFLLYTTVPPTNSHISADFFLKYLFVLWL